MIIECATCAVRDLACHDCVVSVLLGPPGEDRGLADLGDEERAAIAVLANSGLVPPLRLLPSVPVSTSMGDEPPWAVGVGV
jgi:hypothetical protein